MTRAQHITGRLWESRSLNEATFLFKEPQGGLGTTKTGDIEDLFRAKGYTNGHEFIWQGPYVLRIRDDAIDRDVLDLLQLHTEPFYDPREYGG
jgi:hypothetical protein